MPWQEHSVIPAGISCDVGLICPVHAFTREYSFYNVTVIHTGVSWPVSLRSLCALTGEPPLHLEAVASERLG